MKLAYITHNDCLLHEMGPEHPERPDRLRAIQLHLTKTGLLDKLLQIEAEPATQEHLGRAHPQKHLDYLQLLSPSQGYAAVDAETTLCPHSLRAATLAAGALVQAVDGVITGDFQRAFCAVRPPGHHAEAAISMGFCLYNNVAVGVHHAMAQHGVERVAVLDFDIHHCNGTVDIFKDDPSVLVCSSFQYPYYPDRYMSLEKPHIVNTRLSAGDGGREFRSLISEQWVPALEAHQPQLIFISAGFDAHMDDPMSEMNLVKEDYAWITDLVVSMANKFAQGRIISTLEGGYDLSTLARSVRTHIAHLNEDFYKVGAL